MSSCGDHATPHWALQRTRDQSAGVPVWHSLISYPCVSTRWAGDAVIDVVLRVGRCVVCGLVCNRQTVTYGLAVQLRHVKSGLVLGVTSVPPETEQNATCVHLCRTVRCEQ